MKDITAQQLYNALDDANFVVIIPDNQPVPYVVDFFDWEGTEEELELVIEATGAPGPMTIVIQPASKIVAIRDGDGSTVFRVTGEPCKIIPLFGRKANL